VRYLWKIASKRRKIREKVGKPRFKSQIYKPLPLILRLLCHFAAIIPRNCLKETQKYAESGNAAFQISNLQAFTAHFAASVPFCGDHSKKLPQRDAKLAKK